jgi:hypothetical protein
MAPYRSTKSQAPRNKQEPKTQTPRTKQKPRKQKKDQSFCFRFGCFFGLVLFVFPFGPCLLFGACYLVLSLPLGLGADGHAVSI